MRIATLVLGCGVALMAGGCGGGAAPVAPRAAPQLGRTFRFAAAEPARRVAPQIVYTAGAGDTTHGTFIVVADLTTGRERVLARLPGAHDASSGFSEPAWSPDGRRVTFAATQIQARPGGDADHRHQWANAVYVIGADGSGLRRLRGSGFLSASPGVRGAPAWSPDGHDVIARARRGFAVLAVDPGRRSVSSGVAQIRYSPDGGQALLVSGGAVWNVAVHSRRMRRVLDDAAQPDWAPDGSRVVFLSARDHHGDVTAGQAGPATGAADEIYVARADGSRQRRVTSTTISESQPRWSPDARLILFDATHGGEQLSRHRAALAVVRPDGSCRTSLPIPTSLELSPGSAFGWRPGSDTRRIALRCR